MKKTLFFVAALLLSSMAFADMGKIKINTTAEALGTRLGWTTKQFYLVAPLDHNITLRVDTNKNNPSSNCGYYSADNPKDWRMYQARVDSFWLEAANGALIDSVQLTYAVAVTGVLSTKRGSNTPIEYQVKSDSLLYVGGVSKVCLYVGNTTGATNGQLKISNIRIIYRGRLVPTFKFADTKVHQKIGDGSYTNTLNNTSDGVVSYESSEPSVATVDNNGLVTFLGEGETTITANLAESDNYFAATASYLLSIHPDNWHRETFKGANTASTDYCTSPATSVNPSEDTGLKWTVLFGYIGSNQQGYSPVIRQRKNKDNEKKQQPGYLVSDSITGGIDSLSFEWNSNGPESGNWNIIVLINNDTVGTITDPAKGTQPTNATFSVGNLKHEGKFVIRIVNAAPVSSGTDNSKRFVVADLRWLDYSVSPGTDCANIQQESPKAVKVIRDGKLYIYNNGRYVNVLGF